MEEVTYPQMELSSTSTQKPEKQSQHYFHVNCSDLQTNSLSYVTLSSLMSPNSVFKSTKGPATCSRSNQLKCNTQRLHRILPIKHLKHYLQNMEPIIPDFFRKQMLNGLSSSQDPAFLYSPFVLVGKQMEIK